MTKKILCTLGPASMNERTIIRLDDLGVSMFRLNLSHTRIEELAEAITYVKERTHIPLCLDTEGAQIRNGLIKKGSVEMQEQTTVRILGESVVGDETQFSLYPDYIVKELVVGDFVSIDFDLVLLQVIETDAKTATLRVLNGGRMGQNKAVTVDRPIVMPPLTEKDKIAVKIGREMGIKHFALSFANRPEDVDLIRSLAGEDAFIISKIECRNGVTNLKEIAEKCDAILIDRGDLSREFPIERIPSLQKRIIQHCKSKGTEIFVATNLLETMIQSSMPTRAEINDVYTTLETGADGLVLAAETAVGINPVACTTMIIKLIHSFEIDQNIEEGGDFQDETKSLLVEPHGGYLVNKMGNENDFKDANGLREISIRFTDLMDCEQIATGTYSPITGFMDQETFFSVLESNRLPDGNIWTMPIILQLNTQQDISSVKKGERINLTDDKGIIYAILDVSEIYQINLESAALKWFGTSSKNHPGVLRFMANGENCIAGDITLVQRLPSIYRHYQLTPFQTRFIFNHKRWNKVIGFHTRNPAHRVHEYIQLEALTTSHADGLFISPVIGPKKTGDFHSDLIMRSYEILIENSIYPEGSVVLGSFSTYSRYCGPRETVFTMLCRKNMGCSHFIIGRDHAGVGSFYSPEENQKFLESLGDLGIKSILFEEIGYSPEIDEFVKGNNASEIIKISGTEVRESLRSQKELPYWFMRSEVQRMLGDAIKNGFEVFHK